MKRPNATPSCPKLATEILVCEGSLKLPGASGFDSPSTSRTMMTSSVEQIPRIDVYESKARGQNMDGMRLGATQVYKCVDVRGEAHAYIARPMSL